MIAPELLDESFNTVFQVMSEQPDCCPKCQTRLDFIEVLTKEQERVFVNFCASCQRTIFIVED